MDHTQAYYVLAREVEKYSHPLVHFYVRDIWEFPEGAGLGLLRIEMYRLGKRVGFVDVSYEMVRYGYCSPKTVGRIIGDLLFDWVEDSLCRKGR